MGLRKGDFNLSNPMNFIRDFLNYIEKEGIYDKFDPDTQKMITSPGVEALIKEAETYLPKKLKPLEAANLMRDLTEDERTRLIEADEQNRIVDMRKHFQLKMSKNKGAQGLIEKLVQAVDTGDNSQAAQIIEDARALVHGPENVFQSENDNSDN